MTEEQITRFGSALERVGGDQETLIMLAGMTVEDAPKLLSQMDKQVAAAEWSEYARSAHSLRGLLGTFETGEPVSDLQDLIGDARAADGNAVESRHAKISPELHGLVKEIEGIASEA